MAKSKSKPADEAVQDPSNDAPRVDAMAQDGNGQAPPEPTVTSAETKEQAAERRAKQQAAELASLHSQPGVKRVGFIAYSKTAGFTRHFPIMPGFKQLIARASLRDQLKKAGWEGYVMLAFDEEHVAGFGALAILPFREDVEELLDAEAGAAPAK